MGVITESRNTVNQMTAQNPQEIAGTPKPLDAILHLNNALQTDGTVKLDWASPEHPDPARLKPGIQYILVPGKELELVVDPITEQHIVVPSEATDLAASAAGIVYDVNRPDVDSTEKQDLEIVFSGSFTLPRRKLKRVKVTGPKITEARAMATIAKEVGNVPKEATIVKETAIDTNSNIDDFVEALKGKDIKGKVAIITDVDCQEVVIFLLRRRGIEVAQALLFENILGKRPGYEDRVKRYVEERKTKKHVIETGIYQRAHQVEIGLTAMRFIAEHTRGENISAKTIQEENVA